MTLGAGKYHDPAYAKKIKREGLCCFLLLLSSSCLGQNHLISVMKINLVIFGLEHTLFLLNATRQELLLFYLTFSTSDIFLSFSPLVNFLALVFPWHSPLHTSACSRRLGINNQTICFFGLPTSLCFIRSLTQRVAKHASLANLRTLLL